VSSAYLHCKFPLVTYVTECLAKSRRKIYIGNMEALEHCN
jgi:hypothetical protein